MHALREVDLDVLPGEIHALLGENGAGKSTLLHAIYGLIRPDEGEIWLRGTALSPTPKLALKCRVGLVQQHFAQSERHTVLENLAVGAPGFRLHWPSLRARAAELCARYGLDLPLDATIGELPTSVRQKVEILGALFHGATLLLLDEPTASLSEPEAEALFGVLERLRDGGGSVLFTSHKLRDVTRLADRVTVLRRGEVRGSLTRDTLDPRALVAMMVGHVEHLAAPTAEIHRGGEALALRDICVDRPGGGMSLQGVTMQVRSGEVLGIAGVAGSGQRALADLLGGLLAPTSGLLRIGGKVLPEHSPSAFAAAGVAYIPEDRHGAGSAGALSVIENLLFRAASRDFSRLGVIDWPLARSWATERIAEYNIRADDPDAPAARLSGGNLQKVILARELSRAPDLVIAAYPARGLDLSAADAVRERLLMARWRGAAVVLISEDLDEIFRMADIVGVLFQGRLVALVERGEASREAVGRWMAGLELPRHVQRPRTVPTWELP